MGPIGIFKHNVGRIAERIVSNELEYRGFRVSDLNKEGTSVNADLLAARDGKTWQIQVKGASEAEQDGGPWWNYGHCTEAIIAGTERMFNRSSGFYKAEIVVMVSVKSPKEYSCIVLPVEIAERAAQMNLVHGYRKPKKDGTPHKAGKVWVDLDWIPKTQNGPKTSARLEEQAFLRPYLNKWDLE